MRTTTSAATTTTLRRAHLGDHDHLVILLPDPRVLRLVARSVLLFATLVSFPWIRTLPQFGNRGFLVDPPQFQMKFRKWVDNPFLLPMLIADLKREGLFSAECRALFLGDPSSRIRFLKKNRIDVVLEVRKLGMVEDGSVDFVLAAYGVKDSSFGMVDRVLKVGGIVTVRLGPSGNPDGSSSSLFHLPENYRLVYIRRFGSTVVAVKKISLGNVGGFRGILSGRRRLLLIDDMKAKLQKRRSVFLNEWAKDNMKNSDWWSKGELQARDTKIGVVSLATDEVKAKKLRKRRSVYFNELANENMEARNTKIGVVNLVIDEVKVKLQKRRSVYSNELAQENIGISDCSRRKEEEEEEEEEFDRARNAKIGVISLVDGVFGQSMKVIEI